MMLRNRGIFATIARGALLAITCCAAVAQTPVPATLDLRVAATPAATTYLNGARPIARQSAKGVTSYAYKNGWPVLAVRTDGTYAEYKYLNGKLDRIQYSDGTVRRAGDALSPSAGASIASRGGVSPMNYGRRWHDDYDYFTVSDGFGRSSDGFGASDFPPGGLPDNPWGLVKCMYDASRTLQVSLLEVCPIMQNEGVCMGQALTLHNEAVAWCMSGIFG
jgi:hypothetical protein